MKVVFEDADIEIHRMVVGPISNNAYILRCRRTGSAVLIDAANEPERLVPACRKLGVGVALETHGHWDHIQAVPEAREAGISVWVSAADAGMLPAYDLLIEPEQAIGVGQVELVAISTPGHTQGSMCFAYSSGEQPVIFSGDTLFLGGPGNTTSPGASFEAIIDSITSQILDRFPDSAVVLPGHGLSTSVGRERPFRDAWIARGF
jgi:glyoxylase-like metal-dependent hydrolase (beta-lactamase superfamily II)